MQFREFLHVGEQSFFEKLDVAVTPGIDHIVHDLCESHAVRQGLNQHVALRLKRQVVEKLKLLTCGLQPENFLVVTLRQLGQVKFDPMHRVKSNAHQHHNFNIDCGVPWLRLIE